MNQLAMRVSKTIGSKNKTSSPPGGKSKISPTLTPQIGHILFLQRTVGNHVVQKLIKSGALQAKLRIGQPGDKYKHEADRVADAVMRMPEPQVQRQAEEEEMLQAK